MIERIDDVNTVEKAYNSTDTQLLAFISGNVFYHICVHLRPLSHGVSVAIAHTEGIITYLISKETNIFAYELRDNRRFEIISYYRSDLNQTELLRN